MTNEEVARFALVLSEAERVRVRIAEEEAAIQDSGGEPPLLAAVPALDHTSAEHTSAPAAVAAA